MRVLRLYHSAAVGPWRARDRALVAAGVDLTLVSPRRADEGGVDVQSSPPEAFVRLVPTYGRHPYRFVYGPLALWRALRSAPSWDLLDIHEEPASLAAGEVLALAWLARRRAPFLLYTAQNLDKRYPPPFRWLEAFTLRRARAIYPCSDGAAAVIRRKGARGIVRTIGLGVDLEAFRPAEGEAPPGPLRVGYVGRFLRHKGVHVLLEAMTSVPEATLELTGAGPEEEALRTQAARLGLADRVHFAGPCLPEQLPERFRSFDVVVVPSVPTPAWDEQFCRVAVEAMACGVPVIASASGALPEVVGSGGLLVPPGDAHALAGALRQAAADGGDARRARSATARSAAARFAWPKVAEAHLGLYQAVLERAGRRLWVIGAPGWRPDERVASVLRRLAERRPGVEVVVGWPSGRAQVRAGDVVWLLDLGRAPAGSPLVRVLADPDSDGISIGLPAGAVLGWLERMVDGEDLRSVAYLTHVAKPSGAELALLRQLPHVPGVLPTVIVAEDGPLVARLRAAGVPTIVLPLAARTREVRRGGALQALARPVALLDTAAYVLRLRAVLQRLGIQLVHTNSLKAVVYGPPAAKLANLPVIVHVRDRIAADYLGRRTASLVRWWVHRVADGVLANSAATLATLGRPKQASAVLPSTVVYDASVVARRQAVHRSGFTVGMLGRLAQWKGQHVAIDAFALAFSDRPDARLRLAGGALFGEDAYAAELRAQAERLGVADRVELLGHTDDVDGFLASIDVLVHASVIPEPFGQVILEGMSAGVPVVAANAGGPAEIVTDGVDGFLVRPGDAAALSERLLWCEARPDEVAVMVEQAKETVGRFAPEILGLRIRAFYDEVAPSQKLPFARL